LGTDFFDIIGQWTLRRLTAEYPVTRDFFLNLNLPPLDEGRTLSDALSLIDDGWLAEFGLTSGEIPAQLAEFLETMTRAEAQSAVRSLTVIGGRDKIGAPENVTLEVVPGTVVSIVGPTGSGKSRLLADIECLAQCDTPTGRKILIDGESVNEEDRFRLGGSIVAQLSQNMNFVMDLTVREFLEMHARSRAAALRDGDIVRTCFERANELAGEKFTLDAKVTQLSGGQSRALMIADCAFMSLSPIVLIDEIENAGVDRRAAIALLTKTEKIVLISTHDPLLALSADKRVVIKNGGIFKVLLTTDSERESLKRLTKIDAMLSAARNALRSGDTVDLGEEN
jgi:ABC-type lipoprotein export system ATPase subunit